MPLQPNQASVLKELAATFTAYAKSPEWPKSRPAYPSATGFLIDNCCENAQLMKGMLETIREGLMQEKNSEGYKHAIEACKMFQALSQNDNDFQLNLNSALGSIDPVAAGQFSKNPEKLADVLASSKLAESAYTFKGRRP